MLAVNISICNRIDSSFATTTGPRSGRAGPAVLVSTLTAATEVSAATRTHWQPSLQVPQRDMSVPRRRLTRTATCVT